MMHQVIVALLGCVVGTQLICAKVPEKSSALLDPKHLDKALTDAKMRDHYVRCFLEKGVCTPAATEIKRILPTALSDNCSKCSQQQKAGSRKVIQYLMDEQPEMWKQVSTKYDPKGLHKKWFTPTPKDKKTAANKGPATAAAAAADSKTSKQSSNEKKDSKSQGRR
nr:chemosensory protein [Nilaparvata lugens]